MWSWWASGGGLVAGASVTKVVAVENAGFLEQAHGAVDRGDRDARIDRGGAFVQLLDVGVVGALGQNLGDHAPLFGNPQATLGAKGFNVDGLAHV
ncbi:hypothetical protein MBENS4_2811 [Novosphingobium sp. MBES04]|nr:hypothetical protein MBENS4_2811 [Novosphingobium sp. MBES04]